MTFLKFEEGDFELNYTLKKVLIKIFYLLGNFFKLSKVITHV